MRRALLAAGVAGAVIAVEWLRFEEPLAAPVRAGLLVVLAAAVAVLASTTGTGAAVRTPDEAAAAEAVAA